MAQVEADVIALELEKVRPRVPTLFDRDDKFYGFISKKPVEVISNRDMRIPLELRPGGKSGHFEPEGGDLGRGDASRYDKAVVNSVYLKYALEWTLKSQWATDDSRKAVLNNFKDMMAKAMNEFRRFLDAMCMTDGTGVLATVGTYSVGTGTAGGDRLTLDSDGFGAKLLRFGQPVNIYAANLLTNRTVGAERTINFIDYENKIVDIVPSVATGIATDKVVVSGVSATPPVSLLGVPYHHNNASTGSWLGFTRSTTPEIRANRVNAGGTLALPFPRRAINKLGDRVGIDERMQLTAWMHPCQAQAYEELGQMVSLIQKQAREEGLDLYFGENMQMAGAPVKKSFAWDKKRIDFITDVWGRAQIKDVDFHEVGGKKIFEVRGTSGGVVTSMLMYLVCGFNLFVDNPAKCSYIDNLTVPTGY